VRCNELALRTTSASDGIGPTQGDTDVRPMVLIRRLVDATSKRETICGVKSDDIGCKNWVTWPSRAPTRRLKGLR
jgi:hypothetical protein